MKLSIIVLALLAVGFGNYSANQTGSVPKKIETITLNQLLETRRDVLKRRLELIEAENEFGEQDITELTEANSQLKNADLAIATTPATRVTVLERALRGQQRLEDIMRQKFETGIVNESCYLATKAARLKIQIELWREKK